MKNDNEHIWSLDCIAICTLLGMTLNQKQINKLCRKHGLFTHDKELDPFYGFYLLHKACHKKAGIVSKRLTRMLNERHAGIIRMVRKTRDRNDKNEEYNTEIATQLEGWIALEPAGVIWALLTDPRPSFQYQGVYLIHKFAYTAFHSTYHKMKATGQDADSLTSIRDKLQQTRESLSQHKTAMETLRQDIHVLEKERTSLQGHCNRQQKRIAELQARPNRENQLKRRIRILEYELEQLRQDQMLQSKQTSTNPYESVEMQPAVPVNNTTPCSCMVDETGTVDFAVSKSTDCMSCSLNNLRVAVIGGLDRLEPHYRRIVEELGAEFCFHNGDCHGGCQVLKNLVCRSDIILFITRVNSHSALHVVRGLCQKTGKRFTVLRETSPQALAKALPRSA